MDRVELLNDAEETMRTVLDGRQSRIWTAMPGIVQTVDLVKMTCSVQPAIQGTVTDENGNKQNVNYPLLINVPIVFPGAGGFIITFPIAANDEVLVVFASRCIDSWWQSGGTLNQPMEARMHDLSDGFALPGPRSQTKLVGSISSTGAQIRNEAGTAYVEIASDGKIKLVSPSEIDLTGNLKVTGNIQATGEVTAGTIPLTTHRHIGVTPGSGTSGTPVP